MLRCVPIALSAILCAAAASSALAQSVQSVTDLTTGQSYQVDVAVDSSGVATAAWSENLSPFRVRQSTRIDGAWSSPVSLSGGANAGQPRVARADWGGLVTWRQNSATNNIIRVAPLSGGAVSLSASGTATAAPVTVDENGRGLIGYSIGSAVRVHRVDAVEGDYGGPIDLFSATAGDSVSVAHVGDDAAAAFLTSDGDIAVGFVSLSSGEAVSSALDIFAATSPSAPTLVGAGGAFLLSWQSGGTIWAVSGGASGWGDPLAVSDGAGAGSSTPVAAANASGDAVVVWLESGVVTAARRVGGVWRTPEAVSTGGGASSPRVAIDPAGQILVIWLQSVEGLTRVHGAWRVGNAWRAPEVLSDTAGAATEADLAMSLEGQAHVVWSRPTGGVPRAQAAFLVAPQPEPAPVPTLTEWAFIMLAALIALGGVVMASRRAEPI